MTEAALRLREFIRRRALVQRLRNRIQTSLLVPLQQRAKSWQESASALRAAVAAHQERKLEKRAHWRLQEHWRLRIDDAIACPDNVHIPRVPGAGQVVDNQQIMHNGLRIHAGSYFGAPVQELISRNRGVHEPQEERVFRETLKFIRPGSTMLELGAYWGFYSMWFHREVPGASCFLIEPAATHMVRGQQNFALNGMQGTFVQAFIGAESGTSADGTRIISIDDFVAEQRLNRIDLLHSDIQEAEWAMLQGARATFAAARIGHVFISTHTAELYRRCLKFLKERNFFIIAAVDGLGSYSVDGLIAARGPGVHGPQAIAISRAPRRSRRQRDLLFNVK